MEQSLSDEKLPLPITTEVASGLNIEAMKLESSEESTSMIELDVVGTTEGGAEEVDTMPLEEEDDFLESHRDLTLSA